MLAAETIFQPKYNALSLHHIKVTQYQYGISLLMLILITWLKYYLSGFSTVKLFFSPLSVLYSLEGSYCVQSTLKEQRIMIHILKGKVCT